MPVLASGCGERVTDRWLSGQKQQTVNLPTHAVYGGSNPPLSTKKWKIENGNWGNKASTWPLSAFFKFRVSDSQFQIWRGGSNSMVESQPSKLLVAGSIPVSRSRNTVASGQWLVASGRSARTELLATSQ